MKPACWSCNQLIGKPKETPPHEYQRFVHRLAPGLQREIRVYRCDPCGATLHRYDDAADGHPGWWQVPS